MACRRRSQVLSAATIALMSPQFMSGMRLLSANTFRMSWFGTPARKSLVGRSRSPSWKISRARGHTLAGTVPPMSEEWMNA